jgi:hypothetical protein
MVLQEKLVPALVRLCCRKGVWDRAGQLRKFYEKKDGSKVRQVEALLRDYPFDGIIDSLLKKYNELPQGWRVGMMKVPPAAVLRQSLRALCLLIDAGDDDITSSVVADGAVGPLLGALLSTEQQPQQPQRSNDATIDSSLANTDPSLHNTDPSLPGSRRTSGATISEGDHEDDHEGDSPPQRSSIISRTIAPAVTTAVQSVATLEPLDSSGTPTAAPCSGLKGGALEHGMTVDWQPAVELLQGVQYDGTDSAEGGGGEGEGFADVQLVSIATSSLRSWAARALAIISRTDGAVRLLIQQGALEVLVLVCGRAANDIPTRAPGSFSSSSGQGGAGAGQAEANSSELGSVVGASVGGDEQGGGGGGGGGGINYKALQQQLEQSKQATTTVDVPLLRFVSEALLNLILHSGMELHGIIAADALTKRRAVEGSMGEVGEGMCEEGESSREQQMDSVVDMLQPLVVLCIRSKAAAIRRDPHIMHHVSQAMQCLSLYEPVSVVKAGGLKPLCALLRAGGACTRTHTRRVAGSVAGGGSGGGSGEETAEAKEAEEELGEYRASIKKYYALELANNMILWKRQQQQSSSSGGSTADPGNSGLGILYEKYLAETVPENVKLDPDTGAAVWVDHRVGGGSPWYGSFQKRRATDSLHVLGPPPQPDDFEADEQLDLSLSNAGTVQGGANNGASASGTVTYAKGFAWEVMHFATSAVASLSMHEEYVLLMLQEGELRSVARLCNQAIDAAAGATVTSAQQKVLLEVLAKASECLCNLARHSMCRVRMVQQHAARTLCALCNYALEKRQGNTRGDAVAILQNSCEALRSLAREDEVRPVLMSGSLGARVVGALSAVCAPSDQDSSVLTYAHDALVTLVAGETALVWRQRRKKREQQADAVAGGDSEDGEVVGLLAGEQYEAMSKVEREAKAVHQEGMARRCVMLRAGAAGPIAALLAPRKQVQGDGRSSESSREDTAPQSALPLPLRISAAAALYTLVQVLRCTQSAAAGCCTGYIEDEELQEMERILRLAGSVNSLAHLIGGSKESTGSTDVRLTMVMAMAKTSVDSRLLMPAVRGLNVLASASSGAWHIEHTVQKGAVVQGSGSPRPAGCSLLLHALLQSQVCEPLLQLHVRGCSAGRAVTNSPQHTPHGHGNGMSTGGQGDGKDAAVDIQMQTKWIGRLAAGALASMVADTSGACSESWGKDLHAAVVEQLRRAESMTGMAPCASPETPHKIPQEEEDEEDEDGGGEEDEVEEQAKEAKEASGAQTGSGPGDGAGGAGGNRFSLLTGQVASVLGGGDEGVFGIGNSIGKMSLFKSSPTVSSTTTTGGAMSSTTTMSSFFSRANSLVGSGTATGAADGAGDSGKPLQEGGAGLEARVRELKQFYRVHDPQKITKV